MCLRACLAVRWNHTSIIDTRCCVSGNIARPAARKEIIDPTEHTISSVNMLPRRPYVFLPMYLWFLFYVTYFGAGGKGMHNKNTPWKNRGNRSLLISFEKKTINHETTRITIPFGNPFGPRVMIYHPSLFSVSAKGKWDILVQAIALRSETLARILANANH